MDNLFTLFDEATELFWVIDEHFCLVYANKSFQVMMERIYLKVAHKGDCLADMEGVRPEVNLFWKNIYEKAYQFENYSTDVNTKTKNNKQRIHIEFRKVQSITKFLCIKAVVFSYEIGKYQDVQLTPQSEQYTLSTDDSGNIVRISPAVQKLLGYFSEWIEHKPIMQFLHPDEIDIMHTFFRENESMPPTWLRVLNITGTYIWCKIQMAAFGKPDVDRKYLISILEVWNAKLVGGFVPETIVLQIIAEAQHNYILSGSSSKAFETCLDFFKEEGYSSHTFLAGLTWKGTLPVLEMIAQSGMAEYEKKSFLDDLLLKLSDSCLKYQTEINSNDHKVPIGLYNGFTIRVGDFSFIMYLLIQESEILGVLCCADNTFSVGIPKVNPIITYFRSLFVDILHSNRFLNKSNDVISQLAERKDELLSLVASLDDIILEVDKNYLIVNIWCNDEKKLPFSKSVMIGKRLSDLQTQEIGQKLEQGVDNVFKNKLQAPIEFSTQGNLKLFWFAAKMNLVKMFNGDKRVSILVQDITLSKEAEKKMAAALEKEKELNDLKSKMITNVSHEFRTPLATIVSSTELLEMNIKKNYVAINDRATELFSTIYEEVERLTEMMHSFMVMGRFEDNKSPFRTKMTDVESLVKRIIQNSFNIKFGSEKVVIEVLHTPREVELDPSLFWHIISNLVSNAIKYSPNDAQVRVILDFEEEHFVLKVVDKGIGIPENDMHNIFHSFYRASNSEEQNGYGLGLAIVERFAKMHQATIGVFSKVDVGSEFVITFKYKLNGND